MSSNFHLSFYVLPKAKRQAMFDFYQFCRYADDLVDEVGKDSRNQAATLLEALRKEVKASFHGEPETDLGKSLMALRKAFPVQEEYFYDIIAGCEMDLQPRRYETFDDLYQYCYRVASAVGLVCKDIFGAKGPSSREYAIHLGLAFQLTNILRDVREDAERGRIYFPLEDLRKFGYTEEMLFQHTQNQSFQNLMEFEGQRALHYFDAAAKSLDPQDRRAFLPALVMAAIYFRILKRILKNPLQVFQSRIEIPKLEKIFFALRVYVYENARAGN